MQSPIMSGIFSGIGMRMLSRCAWIFAFGLRSKTSSHISESRYLRVSVSSVLRCAFAHSIFCRTGASDAMTKTKPENVQYTSKGEEIHIPKRMGLRPTHEDQNLPW